MLMLMTEKGVGNGGKVGVEEQWEGTSNWDGVVYDFVGDAYVRGTVRADGESGI